MSETNTQDMNLSKTSTEVGGIKPDTYCMLLHLSQLLNFCAPPCGIIVPIVMWAIGKDNNTLVDQHGKVVLNWIISSVIYWMVILVLCFVLVGFFLLPVLLVLEIVFPIIGAVRANEGKVYKYPLSIPFFT